MGQALGIRTAQLGEREEITLMLIKPMKADTWFTEQQQQRLAELMDAWRTARNAGIPLPLEEQAELDTLVEAELRAAAQRSAELAGSRHGCLPGS